MSTKRYASIIVVCLAAIVAGVWMILPRGVPPETGGGTAQKGEVLDRSPIDAGIPTEAIPAPDQTPAPKPSLPPAAPQLPASQPTLPANETQPSPAGTQAPLSPTPTPAQPAEKAIDPSVARFTDASIPVEKRSAELEQLGKSGDANTVQTLMKLGDTYTYLNFKAVEALGNVKTPEVAKYLEGKLGDKDPRVVSYAIQSLAKVQGAEAVPAIAATIAANRQRPDGYQDTVCAAGVKALGEIGSPKAIPALAEEFDKTVGKTLQHEYGSQVVAAIKAIGDASGAPALKPYMVRLEKEHAAMADNPMGQRYLEGKIKEVSDAIAFIEQKGSPK